MFENVAELTFSSKSEQFSINEKKTLYNGRYGETFQSKLCFFMGGILSLLGIYRLVRNEYLGVKVGQGFQAHLAHSGYLLFRHPTSIG